MRKRAPARRNADPLFATAVKRKAVPFPFVLEELDELAPWTRPMFGCTAVYSDERILFILRDKGEPRRDDGVWIATTQEHHASLRRELPSMRSISVLAGGGVTGWQILPVEGEAFEEEVLRACELVRKGDPRIGKVPAKRKRGPKTAKRARSSRK
jgi:hypothetical protein